MEEKYCHIEGYEKYLIYESGKVYSIKTKRFMKPGNNGSGTGYLYVSLSKNATTTRFYIHRLVANYFIPNPEDKRWVDHINGNTLDNSIGNLRWVTESENSYNSKLYTTNTSGVKGVSWNKKDKKWRVRLGINGKELTVGSFKEFDDAVKFAALKRQELHGEFARDN